MSALSGARTPWGGDPEKDRGDADARDVRGALERLADELEETAETLERAIEELGDGRTDDEPGR